MFCRILPFVFPSYWNLLAASGRAIVAAARANRQNSPVPFRQRLALERAAWEAEHRLVQAGFPPVLPEVYRANRNRFGRTR